MRDSIALMQAAVNRSLQLIVLPTEACNFRCVYCYESFQYKRMEEWVVRGIKSLITRRAGRLDRLLLSWFGGEPLLARDIIEEVLGHTHAVARTQERLEVRSEITTNGYLLTPPVFARLVSLGVAEYQISLDGPKHVHDRKRVLAGGRGTFDRIWENLLAMRESPYAFQVIVRLHADRENVAFLPSFLREYAAELGGDSRYELYLRPIGRFGGPNDHLLPILEDEEVDGVVGGLKAEASRLGLRQFDVSRDSDVCYAARANSFVVRANGRLNKCTLALEHPANQVGHIEEDGSLRIDSGMIAPWLRGLFSGDREELACPMMGLAEPRGMEGTSREIPLVAGARSAPVTATVS